MPSLPSSTSRTSSTPDNITPALESPSKHPTTLKPNDKDSARVIVHRSRTGCLTCRSRKIRCDEAKPVCERCQIKSRECCWPPVESNKKSKKRKLGQRGDTPNTVARNSTINPPTTLTLNGILGVDPLNLQEPSLINPPPLPFPLLGHHDPSTSSSSSTGISTAPFSVNLFVQASSAPTVPQPPFDPSSFLDLLPLLPQTSRFYVPPDFLPKTTQPDLFKGLRSNDFLESLMAPRKKAEAMADPAFLKPYFPTIQERLVMRHYLLETVHVIMAFECRRKPWNPWIEIHAPLAFNHLPGTSAAADALRVAMLAVGAVHMRYRHDPSDLSGAWNIIRVAKAKVFALVRQRIEAQESSSTPLEKEDVELLLAALLSCTIASSLAADDSWHELLTSVLSLVEKLGGASNLIREGTHKRLSSFRFMLEQLAIRDVFGCMTTQLPPSILNVAFSPWFFEAEQWSYGDDEWESVERMFGFSRAMVDVIARACTLISKTKQDGLLYDPPKPSLFEDFPLRLPAHAVARINPDPNSDPDPAGIAPGLPISNATLHAEAEGLMAELVVWDNASTFTPFHPRTLFGNHSYRHAIRIRLLREVFGAARDDPRVQRSCASIIELGVEALSLFGRITWFTWPIVIAAFNLLPGDPHRLTALALLGEFGQYACFDNGAASRVLADFYKQEELDGMMSSAQVADRLKSKPFLD